MKKITHGLLALLFILSLTAHAQDDKTQRVQASYILTPVAAGAGNIALNSGAN